MLQRIKCHFGFHKWEPVESRTMGFFYKCWTCYDIKPMGRYW